MRERTGRSRPRRSGRATASTPGRSCASSNATAPWCAASCARGAASATGATSRSCDACAAPRWRRCARRSSPRRSAAGRIPALLAGNRPAHSPGAGIDRLRQVLVALQGLALPVESWERDSCRGAPGPTRRPGSTHLCASGELVSVGAGPLGCSGRVALYFRDDAPPIGPPGVRDAGPPQEPGQHLPLSALFSIFLATRPIEAPCFFTDLLAEESSTALPLQISPEGPRWGG